MERCVLRISRPYEEVKKVFDELEAEYVAVYQHDDASRVHIHAIIKNCDIQLLSFKRRIEKVVGKVSKTDWAFKTTEITDDVITYFHKNKYSPVFVKGYTQEQIVSYHSKWVERRKQSTLDFGKKKENDKATYREIIDEVKKIIPKDTKGYAYDDVSYVVENLIRVLNEKKIITGRYKIRDLIDTIFRETKPERFGQAITGMYMKDFV